MTETSIKGTNIERVVIGFGINLNQITFNGDLAIIIVMYSFIHVLLGRIGIANLIHGTWSAVLLTPLSVAGDHIYGLLDIKYGKTYIDLFLSTPPGFVADFFGYVRPIDAHAGPAWEMRYGLGGTHAAVVPFMNFRIIGVFLIPALWAYILTNYEKGALYRISVINLSLLGIVVTAAPHWLWYGEKNGFNALVIWLLLSLTSESV